MKTIRYLFILLFCTVLLAGCTQAPEVSPAISEEIIQEINFARTQPKQYVTQRLSIIDTSKKSESYKQALDEVIDQMTRMKNPLPELTMADGLYKCAKEWVDVSGPQGEARKQSGSLCPWHGRGEHHAYVPDFHSVGRVRIDCEGDGRR